MSEDKLDLGLEYFLELKKAMKEVGLKTEHAKRLLDLSFLRLVGEASEGISEIVKVDLLVRTDLDPCPLPGSGLEKHKHDRDSKPWPWDPAQLELFVPDTQQGKKRVQVGRVIKWVKKRRAPNACLLDWLRRHPKRLPIPWLEWLRGDKDRAIWFVRTTYRDDDAFEHIRCLCLNLDGQLSYNSRKLTESFGPNDAVVLMIP